MNSGGVSGALNWRSTKYRIDQLAAVVGLVQLSISARLESYSRSNLKPIACVYT